MPQALDEDGVDLNDERLNGEGQLAGVSGMLGDGVTFPARTTVESCCSSEFRTV